MNKENTLYLIVYKEVMERIFSGEKTIEYRECTKYWKKRISRERTINERRIKKPKNTIKVFIE